VAVHGGTLRSEYATGIPGRHALVFGDAVVETRLEVEHVLPTHGNAIPGTALRRCAVPSTGPWQRPERR
jgi:hypothetical protein